MMRLAHHRRNGIGLKRREAHETEQGNAPRVERDTRRVVFSARNLLRNLLALA